MINPDSKSWTNFQKLWIEKAARNCSKMQNNCLKLLENTSNTALFYQKLVFSKQKTALFSKTQFCSAKNCQKTGKLIKTALKLWTNFQKFGIEQTARNCSNMQTKLLETARKSTKRLRKEEADRTTRARFMPVGPWAYDCSGGGRGGLRERFHAREAECNARRGSAPSCP